MPFEYITEPPTTTPPPGASTVVIILAGGGALLVVLFLCAGAACCVIADRRNRNQRDVERVSHRPLIAHPFLVPAREVSHVRRKLPFPLSSLHTRSRGLRLIPRSFSVDF
jgi:hypothetical protein